MGETDTHRNDMMYLIDALKVHFADSPDVYVSGDNFLYYEEGNPRACVSPDVYVVFGVPMRDRDTFMTWKEGGRTPDVVIEVTSKKTRQEDIRKKLPLYEKVLRVPELFFFDPTRDYLPSRLEGFRLVGRSYMAILPVGGRMHSEILGLDLVEDGKRLWLYDSSGKKLPTILEAAEELALLRQELDRLRGLDRS